MATKSIADLNPTSIANDTDLGMIRQSAEDRSVTVEILRDKGTNQGQSLQVGEYGYGFSARDIEDYYADNDANLINASGLFRALATTNAPEDGTINHIQDVAGATATQILIALDTTTFYYRRRNVTWSTWERGLKASSNLGDVASASGARTNLDVYSKAETYTQAEMDERYLQVTNDFSDLNDVVVARTNLGVYAKTETYTRTEMDARYTQRGNNLNDVTDVPAARTNLGLGTAALQDVGTAASNVPSITLGDARYNRLTQNLNDIPNKATARTNLDVYSRAEVVSLVRAVYPVGSVYLSTNSTNPATSLGFGTWVQVAQGRTLIGVGSGVDVNGQGKTFTKGETGGEYNHTLSQAEMPSHNHSASVNDNGHNHTASFNDRSMDIGSKDTDVLDDSQGSDFTVTTSTAFTGISVSIGNKGSGSSHNNIQPYLATYIWERTA